MEIPEVPRLTMTPAAVTPNSFKLSWADGSPSCVLERSPDLSAWGPSELNVETQDGTNSLTVTTTEARQFFRLRCP